MLNKLDRYVGRLIFTPLMASLVIAAMLLILDRMLRLFDFVINEGGPVSVVWRMLSNLIPMYLGLGIPIGLMLGVLLAFRKLAMSSELDAIVAAGVSYTRLLRVPFLYAALLSIATVALVGYVQPYTRYAYEGLRFELRSGALGSSIQVGEFTSLGKRITLRVEQSLDEGSQLRGIFLHIKRKDGAVIAVTAKSGRFLATDDPDILLLRLFDGVLAHTPPASGSVRVLAFKVHDLPIDLPKMESFRARGERELELTLPELYKVQSDPTEPLDLRQQSAANFHRRLIQTLVLFVLPPLALALAVPPKRVGNAIGVFLALALLIVYNEISQATEKASAAGKLSPILGQWGPLLVFAGLSYWLFYRLAYQIGAHPVGDLERAAGRVWRYLRLIFRTFRRFSKA